MTIRVQIPANIVMTQKIHLQEAPLSRMKQDTMGPSMGPIKTLVVKRLIASPRSAAGQISAMRPENFSAKGTTREIKIK